MKLVSFTHHGAPGIGVLERDVVLPLLGPGSSPLGPADVIGLLTDTMPPGPSGPSGPSVRGALPPTGDPVPLAEVRLAAPVAHPPRNVFCVGRNYAEHSEEFSRSGYDATGSGSHAPEAPIVFTKPRTTIVGPDDEVDPHLGLTDALDYEAEIAVVIGRGGVRITPEQAWSHVWGLTLVNDITARDLQQRHKQWFVGKSLDTFLPMGPALVSLDEVDGTDIVLEGRVNGEVRQRASLKEMIFDVPTIIATLSAGMTLEAGDVIATGTPAGVGIGFDPPRFLAPGDELEVSATGLGTLRNRVAVRAGAR